MNAPSTGGLPGATTQPSHGGSRVVEIIACAFVALLMLAIVAPWFMHSRIREHVLPMVTGSAPLARYPSCVNNLKALGRATALYVQDNGGRFEPVQSMQWPAPDGYYNAAGELNIDPVRGYSDPNASWYPCTWCSPPMWTWGDMLYPYLKDKRSGECPNNRRRVSGDDYMRPRATLNYGANFIAVGNIGMGHLASNIKKPSATFMYMDATSYYLFGAASGAGLSGYGCSYCQWGSQVVSGVAAGHGCHLSEDGTSAIGCDNGQVYTGAGGDSAKPNYDRAQDLMGRHFDGLNVCYADGHVRWMSGREMVKLSRLGISVEAGGLGKYGQGGSPWSNRYVD